MRYCVRSCSRLVPVLCLLAPSLLLPACGSSREPTGLVAPAAATFRTFDHPSDDGQTINLEWGRSPSEAPDVFYVVEIASEEEHRAGRFQRVRRLPSLGSLKSDEKRLHDYDDEKRNRENQNLHYVAVEPAKFYPTDAEAVGAKRYYFRLAMVRVGRKTEKRREKVAPPTQVTRERAKEEPDELPKPVLLVAKDHGAQLLGELEAFDGGLRELTDSFESAKPPRIVESSYLLALSSIDNHIEQITALYTRYLGSLGNLEDARQAGPRDLAREATDWLERASRRKPAAGQPRTDTRHEGAQQEVDIEVEVDVESALAYVTEEDGPKVVGSRPALPPLLRPDASGFRALDLPSDDGARIAVEWLRSPSENARTTYVIEIAQAEDDSKTEFIEAMRVPSLAAEKSDQPRYFGFASENEKFHSVSVEPARYFPPDKAAIRRTVVEDEMGRMPASWAPDVDSTKHVAELQEGVAKHLEGLRGVHATIENTDTPLLPRVQQLEEAFLASVAHYHGYARLLRRFENHIASRVTDMLTDKRREVNRRSYSFRLRIRRGSETLYVQDNGSSKTVVASARPNYFKGFKLNNLIFSVLFCGTVLAFVQLARRNPNIFIRRIAGLEAVEEAIGRATEMGRSVFFVHGLGGVSNLATIASLNILGRVCRQAAQYDTRVRVMNNNPIVLAVSQEVVKEAYTEVGRPDAYNPDDVVLAAYDQFSYVAAVGGRMVREQPAAIFLMGYFYAESLLLAETGASTGAIQIAGTDAYSQLPFFVTACDYTLIGEELYAASAYLSREPRMLGSLRGQDIGKAFLMLAIAAGVLLTTIGPLLGADMSWVGNLFKAF